MKIFENLGTCMEYLNALYKFFTDGELYTKGGEQGINYVVIPKEIIYNKEMDDKRVIVFSYLCSHRALNNSVGFSIPELVKWTGLIPNYHKGKINEKYLDILKALSGCSYFEDCPDFEKLKTIGNSNEHYRLHLNIEKFDVLKEFGIIYFDELQRIINFKKEIKEKNKQIDTSKLSAAHILLLLAYIRANINRSPDKPRCCYRLYKYISDDIGISERYISRAVEILDVMDIVKVADCKGKHYKNKNGNSVFITAPKVFADYRVFKKEKNASYIDKEYDYHAEIQKQLRILHKTSPQTEN